MSKAQMSAVVVPEPAAPLQPAASAGDIKGASRMQPAPLVEVAVAPETEPAEENPKVAYSTLYRYADTTDKLLIVVAVLASLGHGVIMPLFSIIMGNIINALNSGGDLSKAVTAEAVKFLYLAAGAFVGAALQNYCWSRVSDNLTNKIRRAYLKALLRTEIGYFDTATSGELVQRMSGDVTLIYAATGLKCGIFLQYSTKFVAGLIIGLTRGWALALVVLACIPLVALTAALMVYNIASLSALETAAYSVAGGIAQEQFSQIRTVAAFTGEARGLARFMASLDESRIIAIKSKVVMGLGIGSTMAAMMGTYALALWFGAQEVIYQGYSGGDVLNCFFAVLFSGMGLGEALPILQTFTEGRTAAFKIFELIDRMPAIDSANEQGLQPATIAGRIELQDVFFSYPSRPGKAVFQSFDLVVEPGQFLALCGESGSGKSTVISLVERLYDPQSGLVMLDGVDIKEINVRWLRMQMGLVSQEPALFATSIRENLRYGREGATDDELEEATKVSNAYSFISMLPKGFDTQVGERGLQLSGGQKQRIAIARAVLRNPKILLLDEATSALDNESERLVQEALDRLMVGRTTIVVAHRLSTVRDADVIAVVQRGSVIETGTYDELVSKKGVFGGLVKLQGAATAAKEKKRMFKAVVQVTAAVRRLQMAAADGAMSDFATSVAADEAADLAAAEEIRAAENVAPRVSLLRLAPLNSPEWPYFVLGCIASAGVGATFPAYGIIFGSMLEVFFDPNHDKLKRDAGFWAGMFCVLGGGYFLVMCLQSICSGYLGANLTHRLRLMLMKAALSQDIGFYDNDRNSSGVLCSRLETDAALIKVMVADGLLLIIQNVCTIASALAISFSYGPKQAGIMCATFPLSLLGAYFQQLTQAGLSGSTKALYERAGQVAMDAVTNARTVAAFTADDRVMGLFNSRLVTPIKRSHETAVFSGLSYGASMFLQHAPLSLSFWFAGTLVASGELSFKDIMIIFFAMTAAYQSISGSAESGLAAAGMAQNAAASIFELIDRKSAVPMCETGLKPDDVAGHIELRDVSFCYPNRPTVEILSNFSLSCPAGKVMALVGESGSGKSTIIGLLERFYSPSRGSLYLDGIEISMLDVAWLRQQIGLVSQEPALFAVSVRENIRYGRPEATNEEVEIAAKSANAVDFIAALQDGYDALVGERGLQLSGGQKQRIAIARAVLRNPKILLLDEATSALDTVSERVVQEALDRLMLGRTTIVIAHRLSSIRHAHCISVVRKGTIVEQGTHDELVAMGGSYAILNNAQAAAAAAAAAKKPTLRGWGSVRQSFTSNAGVGKALSAFLWAAGKGKGKVFSRKKGVDSAMKAIGNLTDIFGPR